jgi:hypothetical protein
MSTGKQIWEMPRTKLEVMSMPPTKYGREDVVPDGRSNGVRDTGRGGGEEVITGRVERRRNQHESEESNQRV